MKAMRRIVKYLKISFPNTSDHLKEYSNVLIANETLENSIWYFAILLLSAILI